MLKVQIIGCGAAGNKATIDLVESQLLNQDDMSYLLLNTTDKDIKPEYRPHAMIFGGNIGGCGKERVLGKTAVLQDAENGVRGLDSKIDPEADFVIVCGSTEGGTGSACIPIVSKYVNEVLHKTVIAVLFFGFGDDARGMQNTIEVCQELTEDIGVVIIPNSKFMNNNSSKVKAESAANRKFIEYTRILVGKDIHESTQNIDITDLKKVIMTPGYMTIERVFLGDVKNIGQYEDRVCSDIDNISCSLSSPVASAKRIAVIFDTKPDTESIDFSCTIFKKRYGIPYELFVHIQDCHDDDPYVTAIMSGQKMPIGEINRIFMVYKDLSTSVDKTTDSFFDSVRQMIGDPDDAAFNMFTNIGSKPATDSDKAAFFQEFGITTETKTPSKKRQQAPGINKTVGEY